MGELGDGERTSAVGRPEQAEDGRGTLTSAIDGIIGGRASALSPNLVQTRIYGTWSGDVASANQTGGRRPLEEGPARGAGWGRR